ncbi:MAG: transposase [Bacteroidales bacterium]|nr:transposase [Bacteroidales bacterium]
MNNADNMPKRKSPRIRYHSYSQGIYFVTICTQDKRHYFGVIKNGEMCLSRIGEFLDDNIKAIHSHNDYADILLYVIMPNHVHMIVAIDDSKSPEGKKRSLLSVVIGGMKQMVTIFARRNNIEFAWQTRFHDHIIRNGDDGRKITEYIRII